MTLVSRVLLFITLAEPAPSGDTGTSRRCQGCSHPSRHLPDQSGRTGGLLRRSPLRTARAAFTASSSSKPRERLRTEELCPCVDEVEDRFGMRRVPGGFGHRRLGWVSRGGRGSPPILPY